MADHWKRWTHFVLSELAAKGPDPQFALLAELGKDVSSLEKLWLAGCYCAHHCVPSAYVIWKHWRPEEALLSAEHLQKWLWEHWHALPVRPEMRSHRMPEKRAKCLHDFARYSLLMENRIGDLSYEDVWSDSQANVKYFGRYMAIKYLEILRTMGLNDRFVLGDIRANDAWGPRLTLALLVPEFGEIVGNRYNNTQEALRLTDASANQVVTRMAKEGITVSYFQLQVLLCEYREMRAGGFYPGAGHDEELEYIDKVGDAFPADAQAVLDARRRIFPDHYLGEIGGWEGIRQDERIRWRDQPEHL